MIVDNPIKVYVILPICVCARMCVYMYVHPNLLEIGAMLVPFVAKYYILPNSGTSKNR
jgi:hypothetical protein